MKNPTFLVQNGDIMPIEKLACAFSSYPFRVCSFEKLPELDLSEDKFSLIPVGSVEFVREYGKCAGIEVPKALWYPDAAKAAFDREVREGTFGEASPEEFVKPRENVKTFTGGIKEQITEKVKAKEKVWISEAVPFESEFRFYVQDTATKWQILGWARYDGLGVTNPEPDPIIVEQIAEEYHRDIGPSAYSVDIGWRPDLGKYSLVEINDAWALGFYENSDPQSNPPTRQQYADMIVSRWSQIAFCSFV
jgi:hypothetical protein